MVSRKILLGTTALIGAGALLASETAQAQDWEVGISGFSRFTASAGDLPSRYQADSVANHNFRVDNEVHVDFTQTDDETGIRYGGRIEFEANANEVADSSDHIDESWIFFEGDFGQFRFGDEDGAADNLKIFAGTISAGTGGIDGAGEVAVGTPIFFDNSGDDTKVIYYTPDIAGFQAGVSYTANTNAKGDREPNNQSTQTDGEYQRLVEAGVAYTNSFGAFDVQGSVVGGYGEGQTNDTDDLENYGAGLSLGFAGFQVAGAYFRNDSGDNADDVNIYNAAIAYSFGNVNTSLGWAYGDFDDQGEPKNIVLSADTGLLPGVSLQGDVGYFYDYDGDRDSSGTTGVLRINFAY
ncbi:MAG: porin [Pseudomonadota bacterium]